MRAVVLSFLLPSLMMSSAALAQEIICGCKYDSLPLFATDPLLDVDADYQAYVTPKMAGPNQAGECYVHNPIAFYEGVPEAIYFQGTDEYRQILIYPDERMQGGNYATMQELNEWALAQCSQDAIPTS